VSEQVWWLQYGAFGVMCYLVWWLTNRISNKLDELSNNINKLENAIISLAKVVNDKREGADKSS
jgi:hypothetical protein